MKNQYNPTNKGIALYWRIFKVLLQYESVESAYKFGNNDNYWQNVCLLSGLCRLSTSIFHQSEIYCSDSYNYEKAEKRLESLGNKAESVFTDFCTLNHLENWQLVIQHDPRGRTMYLILPKIGYEITVE